MRSFSGFKGQTPGAEDQMGMSLFLSSLENGGRQVCRWGVGVSEAQALIGRSFL